MWSVVPAVPGTRIEWAANWCERGSVAVHAWLVAIDVVERGIDPTVVLDTSCVIGSPMVLNAHGKLQVAHEADLDGKPGEIIEP
jgi:hypothetical protein